MKNSLGWQVYDDEQQQQTQQQQQPPPQQPSVLYVSTNIRSETDSVVKVHILQVHDMVPNKTNVKKMADEKEAHTHTQGLSGMQTLDLTLLRGTELPPELPNVRSCFDLRRLICIYTDEQALETSDQLVC